MNLKHGSTPWVFIFLLQWLWAGCALAQLPDGSIQTLREDALQAPAQELLRTVFENGRIVTRDTFDAVRQRASAGLAYLTPADLRLT